MNEKMVSGICVDLNHHITELLQRKRRKSNFEDFGNGNTTAHTRTSHE